MSLGRVYAAGAVSVGIEYKSRSTDWESLRLAIVVVEAIVWRFCYSAVWTCFWSSLQIATAQSSDETQGLGIGRRSQSCDIHPFRSTSCATWHERPVTLRKSVRSGPEVMLLEYLSTTRFAWRIARMPCIPVSLRQGPALLFGGCDHSCSLRYRLLLDIASC